MINKCLKYKYVIYNFSKHFYDYEKGLLLMDYIYLHITCYSEIHETLTGH